jgi:hypothetical protein
MDQVIEETEGLVEGVDYKIIYGYADGFTRDKNGTPIMTVAYCSKEKYEEERRINWQTAYCWKVKISN